MSSNGSECMRSFPKESLAGDDVDFQEARAPAAPVTPLIRGVDLNQLERELMSELARRLNAKIQSGRGRK